MHSYIKKDTIIREFRSQVKGKSKKVVEMFDSAFFDTLNCIYKKKPHDVKFHITKDNTLVFNIDFKNNLNVYLEHFPKSHPTTLMTISHGHECDENTLTENTSLQECLGIIEESITT